MSEESDKFVKRVLGVDPEADEIEALWDDFQRFMVVLLFKELCDKEPDPKRAGEAILAAWRTRVFENLEENIAEDTELSKSLLARVVLAGERPPEIKRGQLQDHVNDIEGYLRGVLNLGLRS